MSLYEIVTPQEIIEWCRGKMAGYKKPKSVDFISPEEMPRTTTLNPNNHKLNTSDSEQTHSEQPSTSQSVSTPLNKHIWILIEGGLG